MPGDRGFLCFLEFCEDGFRDFFRRVAIVGGEGVEHGLVPNPVLEHLRRRLDEVTRHACAGETCEPRLRENAVQRVAELVKQCLDVVVREQRRLVLAGRGEVADQRDGGPLVGAVRQAFAGDQREHREVVVLAVTREHVEVQRAERVAGGVVVNEVQRHLVVPFVRRSGRHDLQAEDAFVHAEHPVQRLFVREKHAELLGVHGVLFLLQQVHVIEGVPHFEGGVSVAGFAALQLGELLEFGLPLRLEAAFEVHQKLARRGAVAGHLDFAAVVGPRLVAELGGDVGAELQDGF